MADRAPDILELHAEATPDKPAVIDDRPGQAPRGQTFAEIDRYANRIANGLLDRGVGPADKVIFCGQNSLELMAIVHATRKVGATMVPLNYRLAPEEAAYVVDNSDSVLAWVDADYAPLFTQMASGTPDLAHVVVFGGDPHGDQVAEADFLGSESRPEVADAGDTASMIYTSGTTGRPKGAYRRAQGNVEDRMALLQLIGYRPDDVYLTTGPLYHSGPLGFAAFAFAIGQTVVVQHRFDPEDWLRLVDTHRVTSTFSAPTPIRMVCTLPDDVKSRYDRSSMRIMIANAAPWPYALKQRYVADFPPASLWEVYGSTEMGVNTVLEPADQLRKPGSCGRPAPGNDLVLIDDDGNEVTEPHTPGELFVRSETLIDTYYKADDAFDAEHRGDLHTVGDVAYFDDEGYFYICDRKKDMIISGGMNIYPAEVEAALEHHPLVHDAAVFGIPSDDWGESVHAVVVVEGGELTEDDVIAFAREHLAGYKIPRSVTFTDELPRTGSGKLLKRELRAPFWEAAGAG